MRIALLSPTSTSLYARATAALLTEVEGIDLVGIVIRSIFSWSRFRAELRRDGPRLLRKIHQKLVMGKRAYPEDDPDTMGAFVRRIGLARGTLKDDARRWGIPLRTTPTHNHPRAEGFLRELAPDLIVFTGGGLVRRRILELAPRGVLNCHSGILPRYRGMDVVEWALLEGAGSGVGLTTHIMDAGVDTGPILLQHVEQVQPGDSVARIRQRLEPHMVTLMVASVRGLQLGTVKPRPQLAADGRQYFVMHPRLQELAEQALTQQQPD
jgi:folate-dependent phosphoribosylglycinamide formyltransferase PurN